jgi:cyclic beta-1,2-glucan synthetase
VDTAAIDRLEALTPYARKVLLAGHGQAHPPIRAELFGSQRFEEHGRSLALAQLAHGDQTAPKAPSFFPRVEQNIAALRQAYDYVALTSHSGHYVTPAADWLLDNFHVVEAQLQQIREGVPRRYYADLPKLAVPPLEGLPRIYGIAWAYVAHTDSVLNPEIFSAFLNAYQEVTQLRLSELWALPTTLRVVLLENLRRTADSIASSTIAREVAHGVWDSAASFSDADLDALNELMQKRGLQRAYLTQLWQRMPTERLDSLPALVRWTEQHCPDGPALMMESQTAQVAANLTVSNIITTLRLIGQAEWPDLIEPLSHSLRELHRLPSFAGESELTRKQITHAMERLARRSGQPELAVAQAVVHAALRSEQGTVEQTAGYHLIGPGLGDIAATMGLGAAGAGRRRLQQARLGLYIGTVAIGTALLLWAGAHGFTGNGWNSVLALFLLAWPASEAAASFVHRLIAESLKIQFLPRLDFSAGIPAAHGVLVVVPTLLTSVDATRTLVQNLCLHRLANREEHAQFALLTDWPDAASQNQPGDAALLDDALAQIEALNARFAPAAGAPPAFVLIHRPRSWCQTQRTWLGWERKRGKLELLVRWLATGRMEGFAPLAPGMRLAEGIRYIVTLDSDTWLPPGVLRELVAVAAHPLNAPRVDAATRRVVGGHGILQPRVVTPLPPAHTRTPFQVMFAGHCGIDPYSSGVSDIYQDLFGAGSFSGKGLLNVQAVYATLDQRLPSEAVLSHDLLEGSVARCGYVSDVALIEDHPHHAGVANARVHRWTRGDWQLVPLMLRARHYGIDGLGLWKMIDNLRRALVLPVSAVLLAWVLFTGDADLGTAVVMVLAALLAGPLMGALSGLVPTRRGIAWQHFFHVGAWQLGRVIAGAAWQFSQLAVQAALLADAALRTGWRLAVSRRDLLQWTTAAQSQASAQSELPAFARQHARVSLACGALALAALAGPHPVAGPVLFLLWALAPLAAWWASKPVPPNPLHELSKTEKDYLLNMARDTWLFFERCVTAQDNHLPPDNLQLVPEPTIAHRTSPTNVGLYLMAVACAREFGWIDTDQMAARLSATLDTLERLPKHDGHLLNWYDTQTLQILQPAYVSTVDSGNLAGLLLTVAQACLELATQAKGPPETNAALQRIAVRCHTLHEAMDFRGLYDAKRQLFHIGLRVAEQALDASYYDLLASESRLTSFLAIAKGDIPRRHWQALGRPFLSVGVTPGLKSWSGSMFEYLMPSLLMTEPEHGLLHEAARAAVAEQQAYGVHQKLPWGVSESAYFAQDHSLAFQYSPFGVPRLALRRTPSTDRVVAPYASLLAALFEPRAAVANLQRLQVLGARGDYGMYEALDFTVLRQAGTQTFSLVEAFMAHHQGMALAALCNVLCGQAPQRWFAADRLVQAYQALLHESTPRQIIKSADPRPAAQPHGHRPLPLFQSPPVDPAAPGWKPTQLLSNGHYNVALRPNGAGVSRWHGQHISRWRDDLLRDDYGTFFYLRTQGQPVVSLTASPAPGPRWRYQARFLADRVQYEALGDGIAATITVLVSPEDDTELRTVSLHNTGNTAIGCELVSCFEAVLADPRADEAHPAFSNLFVQTRWQPQWRALVLARKPRLHGDPVVAAAHFLAQADAHVVSVGCIADRRTFLGRGGSPAQPVMAEQALLPDGAPINGLDPVASLTVALRIEPGAIARLTFATAAAASEGELEARIDKYLQPMHLQRATRMAATLAQVRLRDLGLGAEENLALQDLTTALMYGTGKPASEKALVDQRQLWRFGISGDKPIVLVRIHSANGMALVHALLRAQPWWSFGGLAVDVVVLNSEANSYLMPLQRDILALRDRLMQAVQHSFPRSETAGFHLLREQEVAPTEKAAFTALARVILTADGRPLDVQVTGMRDTWTAAHHSAAVAIAPAAAAADSHKLPSGRFDPDSGEFQFSLAAGQLPARPWINVIANANFGFQVSETGSGYTWAINSRLHQITPWSNDAVRDPAFEHWLLQDLDSGNLIALAPGPHASQDARYRVRHGQGYTVFESGNTGLMLETTFFSDLQQAAKVVEVRLRNAGPDRRKLRALAMAEWQLGAARAERRTIHTSYSPTSRAVFAQQRESRAGFGGSTAFLALVQSPSDDVGWTCDRGEFFDTLGRLVLPETLGRTAGTGRDPCGALVTDFVVEPGRTVVVAFVLGHAPDAAAAQQLAADWSGRDTSAALAQVKDWWNGLLGQVQVSTPDNLFDALVNRWLLYQTVACRLWSKAAFYQAGGASGFRDQLQDSMALALASPNRLREQIVLNASRQFPEGDVQHWWHMPGGEGVRTHFSDDLLWLPYACAHYVEVTGDAGVLDQQVPFLDGPPIPEGAEDAYYTPRSGAHSASVYEHCALAIDKSLAVGQHGLPLMGTGDWNDGMNRVGHQGRGESVWLAWFLCSVTERFAPLAQARGETQRAQGWLLARQGWIAALHTAGWDGAWFRRAFFDNGAALGSRANEECSIDLIAQAWAVLSGASSPAYTVPAMEHLQQQLIDREAGLLRLLHPPLQNSENNPGYIQAYPPGVRENGGQYSHGAVWALMAQALAGDADGAWQSFQSLSPAHRNQNAQQAAVYELEPYVMAGDIYSAPPYTGRGGWSWYTGSAAWLYRAALETLLGLAVRPGRLSLSPRLPAHWPAVQLRLKLQGHVLTVHWQRDLHTPSPVVADQSFAWGEWMQLKSLPQTAVLLVHGQAAKPTSGSAMQAVAPPAQSLADTLP